MRGNKLNWQLLDKLKQQTLIESTASSLRLAGIDVTNKDVVQIVHQSVARSIFEKNFEKTLSRQQLKVWNHLEYAFESTPGEISKATGVARPTVSQALNTLMRLKKVERLGQGRATRYRKL